MVGFTTGRSHRDIHVITLIICLWLKVVQVHVYSYLRDIILSNTIPEHLHKTSMTVFREEHTSERRGYGNMLWYVSSTVTTFLSKLRMLKRM